MFPPPISAFCKGRYSCLQAVWSVLGVMTKACLFDMQRRGFQTAILGSNQRGQRSTESTDPSCHASSICRSLVVPRIRTLFLQLPVTRHGLRPQATTLCVSGNLALVRSLVLGSVLSAAGAAPSRPCSLDRYRLAPSHVILAPVRHKSLLHPHPNLSALIALTQSCQLEAEPPKLDWTKPLFSSLLLEKPSARDRRPQSHRILRPCPRALSALTYHDNDS